MARADIQAIRGDGWQEIRCDAPDCEAAVETRTRPDGWTRGVTESVASTASVKDYCPAHASLAGNLAA